jgi:hypothetical protein
MGCPDEDAALVPHTITMMREEITHRSDSKGVGVPPPYELSSKSSSSLSMNSCKQASKKVAPSHWRHGNWNETVAGTSVAGLFAPNTSKPSPLRKVSSSASGQGLKNTKSDLEHKKSLWRVFRRRMNEERRLAVQMEQQKQQQQQLQLEQETKNIMFIKNNYSSSSSSSKVEETRLPSDQKESDQLLGSLVSIDPHGEYAKYEMVLPKMFELTVSDCGDKEKQSWSVPGGFWEFWNMLSGQSSSSRNAAPNDDAGDTVSTSDETSLASDFTTSSESQASWYSWQSAETQQVSNRGGTRDLLLKHFGGENDSPWLAAKRGDLNALENRWKHRHDWTLEDEHGNTPLYYACRYGGASNLRVVFFLLQQWPSTQHIPPMLLHRCRQDAANMYVQELLLHPCHAEMIIQDFEQHHIPDKQHNDEDSEQGSRNNNTNRLYDIFEDDDDDDDEEEQVEEEKKASLTGRPEF